MSTGRVVDFRVRDFLRDDPAKGTVRREGEPKIFRGIIACANRLLKSPVVRDELRDRFSALAVEMEGSGVAEVTWGNDIGYLVVRGVCDYCDTNKGDGWQGY